VFEISASQRTRDTSLKWYFVAAFFVLFCIYLNKEGSIIRASEQDQARLLLFFIPNK
jgi:hypothetical protein